MGDTAVYIGAGTDIVPILKFKNIKTFIYVDSQPLTEFGSIEPYPEYERSQFPIRFYTLMKKYGFHKIYNEDTLVHIYYNPISRITLKYFMSVCFPNNLSDLLLQEISRADTLICCGYLPGETILDLMKPGPKIFIGNDITCYNDDSVRTVAGALKENSALMSEYIRIDFTKGYPYWEESNIEENHVARFNVTIYKTLQDMIG